MLHPSSLILFSWFLYFPGRRRKGSTQTCETNAQYPRPWAAESNNYLKSTWMKWQIQPEFLSSLYLIPNSSPFPLLRGWPGVDSGGGVGVRVHSSLYQENPGSTSCGCCAGARVSYFIFKRRGHIPFIQAFEPIYFNTPHVRGGSRTCTREGGGGGGNNFLNVVWL